MYLLNLTDGAREVAVPMWDSEWSESERFVIERSSPRARYALFLVGLLGISHAGASARALAQADVPAVRVASVQDKGMVVYAEPQV